MSLQFNPITGKFEWSGSVSSTPGSMIGDPVFLQADSPIDSPPVGAISGSLCFSYSLQSVYRYSGSAWSLFGWVGPKIFWTVGAPDGENPSPALENDLCIDTLNKRFYYFTAGDWVLISDFSVSAEYPLEASAGVISMIGSRVKRTIDEDITIPAGYTQFLRNPIIEAGVTLTIEPDGEAYVL